MTFTRSPSHRSDENPRARPRPTRAVQRRRLATRRRERGPWAYHPAPPGGRRVAASAARRPSRLPTTASRRTPGTDGPRPSRAPCDAARDRWSLTGRRSRGGADPSTRDALSPLYAVGVLAALHPLEFSHGAWVALLLIGVLVFLGWRIRLHYDSVHRPTRPLKRRRARGRRHGGSARSLERAHPAVRAGRSDPPDRGAGVARRSRRRPRRGVLTRSRAARRALRSRSRTRSSARRSASGPSPRCDAHASSRARCRERGA